MKVMYEIYKINNNNMKLVFESLRELYESQHYKNTSWERKGIKITIQEVEKYLDEKEIPEERILVKDVWPLCVHRDKKDEETRERSEKSDLRYPIIAVRSDDKITMILDGHHRLLKAKNHGKKYLKARVLDLEKAPKKYKTVFG